MGGSQAGQGRRVSPAVADAVSELADDLVTRSEATLGCIEFSQLANAVQEADLSDEDAQALQDMLEARGVEIRDDCGRNGVEQTSYVIHDLAQQTTDAMALFLHEVRRHPLLTRERPCDFCDFVIASLLQELKNEDHSLIAVQSLQRIVNDIAEFLFKQIIIRSGSVTLT